MHILLIITGSIAAFRSLEFIRLARESGHEVTPVLTAGGKQFVTPMSVAALAAKPVYEDLFSLKDEAEMGHIRLSREADVVLVAPASADILAKMAHGVADDLASTLLLATDKPVYVAPAMNPRMWMHPATQRNIRQLAHDGIRCIGPEAGMVACGEEGDGRMSSPQALLDALLLNQKTADDQPLRGVHVLVTAGPTYEALDDVRFIGNRSSGRQGYAIAKALVETGASVTLVSGPTALPAPKGVQMKYVESAADMLTAVEGSLPADIFIATAAVADWTPKQKLAGKLKKEQHASPPALQLHETVDILSYISQLKARRPRLVVGFAAEAVEEDAELQALAEAKRKRKGCDWLLANAVAGGQTFGQEASRLLFVTDAESQFWPQQSKEQSARQLADAIVEALG